MKYGNIYKVLIMAVLAVLLSLSMRLLKIPKRVRSRLCSPETATELTEEDITAETERNQTTMATYPDEVEAKKGNTQPKYIRRGRKRDYTACYFTNTENTIDVDSTLPVGAQGRLTDDAQRYLTVKESRL